MHFKYHKKTNNNSNNNNTFCIASKEHYAAYKFTKCTDYYVITATVVADSSSGHLCSCATLDAQLHPMWHSCIEFSDYNEDTLSSWPTSLKNIVNIAFM